MLDLNVDLAPLWDQVIWSVRNRGIFRSEEEDKLIWKGCMGRSSIYVKDIYIQLQLDNSNLPNIIFSISFWKLSCPIKIILFTWLVFHNKNLTWDNLQKRNWCEPAICPICKSNEEKKLSHFPSQSSFSEVWKMLADHFGFNRISFPSIKDAFQWWSKMKLEWRPISLFTIWAIWKWRNSALFYNSKESHTNVLDSIFSHLYVFKSPNILQISSKNLGKNMDPTMVPCAYFDGAAMNGFCACGVFIIPCEDQHIDIDEQ